MDQLVAGSLLGPYRIEGLLGTGGMGSVYRAQDTRLDRAVAIKTSSDRFTERFAREARAISALNHPNVCTLYDVGPNYLVMELIDGRTLEDRLAFGPVPVDEALVIAVEIADALDAAHEKGIVHRDLKPANIKITASRRVKVLDFGLAKWPQHGDENATIESLTQAGAVLGTAGYMAPEQLQGGEVDKRADIWAFGVVLYEMLTGERPAASGLSKPALEAVLASDPRWKQVPRDVQRLVGRCLAPDPRHRLRDIADVRLLIDDDAATPEIALRTPSRRAFTGALGGAAGLAAVGAWGWLRSPAARPPQKARFVATLPIGARVYQEAVTASSLALSPDGRLLVVAAAGKEERQLYRRALDELIATALPGTAGAAAPFFSPDGDWIGFFADGRLQRVPAEGGPAVDICEAVGAPIGASWGADGRIVFTCGWRSPLFAAPASGGPAKVVVPLEPPEINMRRPTVLPDGRVLLDIGHPNGSTITTVNLANGRRLPVIDGSNARYANGRLVVGRSTTLLAAPFDPRTLALTGEFAPLVEGVASVAGGTQHYAVAANGTLAYVPGVDRFALALVNLESGTEIRVLDERLRFHRPRFDASGQRLAVTVAEARGAGRSDDNVWIYDLGVSEPGRLVTTGGGSGAVWAPDGTAIAFAGDPFWTSRDAPGLYTKKLAGGAAERQLASLTEFHRPIAWTPEGLLFELTTDAGEFRIELLAASGERRPIGPGIYGRLSADGRWLVYMSDHAGRDAIYVTDWRAGGTPEQIADGRDPAWGPRGAAYFWRGDQLTAATINAEGALSAGPSPVLDLAAPHALGDYDISPDGSTLALIRPVDPLRGREVVVAFDWLA